MTHDDEKVTRVVRVTLPTASFSLKQSQIAWIARAAQRAGVSKSEYVRRVLDRDIAENGENAA